MLGAIKDSIGSFLGTNRSRPTISAEQLGYSQEDYDALKDRREDYVTDFEGEGGFADQAKALRAQQQGFLNRLTGDGGLYDRVHGRYIGDRPTIASIGLRGYGRSHVT